MASILVVEDSPTVLYTTSQMLTDGGHNVLKARDGQEKPSLVLLDVILPKLNGYQVCRQLKSTPETAHIPVVMITSKSKERDRHWGMEQGADDYITKPLDGRALLKVVEGLVTDKVEL
jgi:twitching motility two-component system response regulator PilH